MGFTCHAFNQWVHPFLLLLPMPTASLHFVFLIFLCSLRLRFSKGVDGTSSKVVFYHGTSIIRGWLEAYFVRQICMERECSKCNVLWNPRNASLFNICIN